MLWKSQILYVPIHARSRKSDLRNSKSGNLKSCISKILSHNYMVLSSSYMLWTSFGAGDPSMGRLLKSTSLNIGPSDIIKSVWLQLVSALVS